MYINKAIFRENWRAYAETLTGLPLTDDQLKDFIRRDTYGQYKLKDHEYTWLVEMIREMEEEMEEEREEEKEEEKEEGRVMDLMYKVMMGDQEAATILKEITETSEKAARLAAENGLDLVTFIGMLATMADVYQCITKVSNEKLYEVWNAIPHIRGAINDICGDPLEMSGI